MGIFFTEIDALAKELEFQGTGSILTIQWGSEISEGLSLYKRKDWKKFNIKGGGGTLPEIVFNYLNSITTKVGSVYRMRDGKVDLCFNGEKKSPLLIFLTDGVFFNSITEKNLGLYKNNTNNIIWFTKSNDRIKYKNPIIIRYES